MNEMTNSHILIHEFEYLEPASLEEAIALLSQHGDRARVLAGGTDLIVQMKMERLKPAYVVNVGKVPGLDGVRMENGELRIGALVPIYALRNTPYVQSYFPALAEACAAFSTVQVQVMGTLGGNLCNGSPASDTAPALIAYGAQVVLAGPGGERRLPVEDFFLGPGKTALQPGELLVAIVLPLPAVGTGSAFLKMTRVAADLAKANVAVSLLRDGERIMACRVACGSVAPRPFRAQRAEALLAGQTFSPNLVAQAAQAAAAEITPIDDVRSTAHYRRRVVDAMVQDALTLAWQRAGVGDGGSGGGGEWVSGGVGEGAQSLTPRASRTAPHTIRLTVNGTPHQLTVAPNELLINVLRERLELTGSKYGCGIGECGACTVQMDGRPVLSCLVLAVAADGREILTVEGLQRADGTLDPLQEAFVEHAAFQCGYCTPGMLMTAKALLAENPAPTEDDVRDYMKGNLCRCTGYASIVRAVMSCGAGD